MGPHLGPPGHPHPALHPAARPLRPPLPALCPARAPAKPAPDGLLLFSPLGCRQSRPARSPRSPRSPLRSLDWQPTELAERTGPGPGPGPGSHFPPGRLPGPGFRGPRTREQKCPDVHFAGMGIHRGRRPGRSHSPEPFPTGAPWCSPPRRPQPLVPMQEPGRKAWLALSSLRRGRMGLGQALAPDRG